MKYIKEIGLTGLFIIIMIACLIFYYIKKQIEFDEYKIASGCYFDFSNDFVLLVKEKDKTLPYLAISINDIQEFR